jgi:hypothetical protein
MAGFAAGKPVAILDMVLPCVTMPARFFVDAVFQVGQRDALPAEDLGE